MLNSKKRVAVLLAWLAFGAGAFSQISCVPLYYYDHGHRVWRDGHDDDWHRQHGDHWDEDHHDDNH
jgi:hypothetical protein